jgi:uncharacterized protein (DUF1501 family)
MPRRTLLFFGKRKEVGIAVISAIFIAASNLGKSAPRTAFVLIVCRGLVESSPVMYRTSRSKTARAVLEECGRG